MDKDQFWKLISDARLPGLESPEDWDAKLTAVLCKLEPDAIVEWNHIFDRFAAQAYTADLWGAAYIINGGASDDGFYYFRCWLIGMGCDVYESTIDNPDSLADVVDTNIVAEAEIYGAAHQAWMDVTGQPDTADYPCRMEIAKLIGEFWDFDDENQFRQHLPRLSKMYL